MASLNWMVLSRSPLTVKFSRVKVPFRLRSSSGTVVVPFLAPIPAMKASEG
jgi:hypothetical protein